MPLWAGADTSVCHGTQECVRQTVRGKILSQLLRPAEFRANEGKKGEANEKSAVIRLRGARVTAGGDICRSADVRLELALARARAVEQIWFRLWRGRDD